MKPSRQTVARLNDSSTVEPSSLLMPPMPNKVECNAKPQNRSEEIISGTPLTCFDGRHVGEYLIYKYSTRSLVRLEISSGGSVSSVTSQPHVADPISVISIIKMYKKDNIFVTIRSKYSSRGDPRIHGDHEGFDDSNIAMKSSQKTLKQTSSRITFWSRVFLRTLRHFRRDT
jgi:hypothetical protein